MGFSSNWRRETFFLSEKRWFKFIIWQILVLAFYISSGVQYAYSYNSKNQRTTAGLCSFRARASLKCRFVWAVELTCRTLNAVCYHFRFHCQPCYLFNITIGNWINIPYIPFAQRSKVVYFILLWAHLCMTVYACVRVSFHLAIIMNSIMYSLLCNKGLS